MALIYVEKFSKYAVPSDIFSDNPNRGPGGGSTAMVDVAGRFGERIFSHRSATIGHGLIFPWDAVTASETIIISVVMRWAERNFTPETRIMRFSTATAVTHHWELLVNHGGRLVLRGPAPGSTLVAVADVPLCNGAWHRIEIKVNAANEGSAEIRLDGIPVLSVNADFRNGSSGALTNFHLFGTGASEYINYDELVICDDTGSEFNDFLGDFRIVADVVDGDGSVSDWVPSAGSSYECVDDALAAYDDDDTYIESSTDNADAYFTHPPRSISNLDHIKFVALTSLARQEGGANSMRLQVESGGIVATSAAVTPAADYQWITEVWPHDPDTGLTWDLAAANAAELGARCQT